MRVLRSLLAVPLVALLAVPAVATASPAPSVGPVGSVGAASPAAPAAERSAARTVIVHNVGGRIENRGRVDPVARSLVRFVREKQPYAAVLQEICGRQAFATDRRLEGYRIAFFPTGVQCEGGQGFGNAVLVRNGPMTTFRTSLPTGGQGSRNLGCVKRPSPRVAVCSTHLTADRARGGDRVRQATKIARVTRGFVRDGYATFVGGDFNDTPTADTLDPLYRPAYGGGARGVYTESDGCCGRDGRPTLGTAKFDYGFASWQWRVARSWTAGTGPSDHRRLLTVLRLR